MYESIALLGKLAALEEGLQNGRAPELPPTTFSHSRQFKVKGSGGNSSFRAALRQPTGNAQSPYRYGRKIDRKVT